LNIQAFSDISHRLPELGYSSYIYSGCGLLRKIKSLIILYNIIQLLSTLISNLNSFVVILWNAPGS